jgi:hypothetical protein
LKSRVIWGDGTSGKYGVREGLPQGQWLWVSRRKATCPEVESRHVFDKPLLGASVTARKNTMLAYLTILGASVAGFAGGPPWLIAVTAMMLSSLSFLKYGHIYERGRDTGFFALVDEAVVRSFFNAVVATSSAYGLGWLLRFV